MEKKTASDFIDLKALWRDYTSRWYWFVISIFIAGLVGYFIITRQKTEYAVTATVLIEDEDKGPSSTMDNFSFDMSTLMTGSSPVDDEVFLVSSHSLYRDVAKDLGLDRIRFLREGFMQAALMREEYPLDVIVPPMFADTTQLGVSFKVKVHKDLTADVTARIPTLKKTVAKIKHAHFPVQIKTELGLFLIDTTKYFNRAEPEIKMFMTVGSYDRAAEGLQDDVSVSLASKKANVIRLNYETPDPKFGMLLLNTIMRHYNDNGVDHKNQQSLKTLEFLDDRINILLGQIHTNESKVRNYKESEGLVDLASEAAYNLSLKGEVASRLFEAETKLEIMKMAWEFLTTPGNEYALVPYQNVSTADNPQANDGINELVTTYNKLVLERMKMASNAKHDNVALRKISEQLDALRANIILTMSKVAESAQVAVDELHMQLNRAQGDLVQFPRQELEMRNINRNAVLLQSLYSFLTQKREETAILLANTMPKGRIVDEAYRNSEPVSMSKKMILAICLLFGGMIPFIGIYLLSIFRTRLVSREEIEGATTVPSLGEICNSRAGKSLVVTPGSKSSTVELFKLVRTNLQFVLTGSDQKVVIVTSSQPGEGKSFISINTAAALAMTGKRVALVGMDIRKPRLAEYLGLPPHTGVTAYLSDDNVTVDDITMRSPLPVKDLDVITAGVVPPNPSELLLTKRVDELFATLRERYDYVIVDSAPLGMVSDTFSLGRVADATIFVTRLNVTTRANMRLINHAAEEKRLPRIGIVVNGTHNYARYGYGEGEAFDREEKKPGFFGRLFRKK